MATNSSEPGPSFGESFGQNAGVYGNAAESLLNDIAPARTTTIIDRKKQTVLSPEAIDQFIYQALSGQSGIAAIRSAEAGSGGYGSSSAALQSADLVAAVAGEIGQMTGPKVEQSETTQKKKKSIICTILYELGDIPPYLYEEGQEIFQMLPPSIIAGYHFWGYPVSILVRRYGWVRRIARFIALKRYLHVLGYSHSITGMITVVIGEPICEFIGRIILRRKYGY